MSDSATADSGGGATTAGVADHLEGLRSLFESFNELVRTEGDVLAWVRERFDPNGEYRPVEDRDWFSDPPAIARAVARWIETWSVGKYRIEPEEILDLGDERFLVTARHRGVARRSEVPIEAVTYIALIWRGGKIVRFDEYLDREGALAAWGKATPAAGAPEVDARPALAERAWKLSDAAFSAVVRRRSDRQLERLFGSASAQRAIFRRMEQLFDPTKTGGFAGVIQYELVGPEGVDKWVVQIDGERAVTRPGEAGTPAATLRMTLPLFIRVAARQLHPVRAYRKGWVALSGDVDVAARSNVMFGLSR